MNLKFSFLISLSCALKFRKKYPYHFQEDSSTEPSPDPYPSLKPLPDPSPQPSPQPSPRPPPQPSPRPPPSLKPLPDPSPKPLPSSATPFSIPSASSSPPPSQNMFLFISVISVVSIAGVVLLLAMGYNLYRRRNQKSKSQDELNGSKPSTDSYQDNFKGVPTYEIHQSNNSFQGSFKGSPTLQFPQSTYSGNRYSFQSTAVGSIRDGDSISRISTNPPMSVFRDHVSKQDRYSNSKYPTRTDFK